MDLYKFGSKLSSLGGRVGYEKTYAQKYIDLEEFFLESTIYVFEDERLAICIENWIHAFGFLLSPSKIKKLITKEDVPYDPAVLGVFLDIIENQNKKQINVSSLRKFVKKKKTITYRSKGKVKVSEKYFDKNWSKYNIATPTYHEEFKKNLLSLEFITKNVPEIGYRAQGLSHLEADYKAYLDKEGINHSLRSICKKIYGQYSNLHKIYSRLKAFNFQTHHFELEHLRHS